MAETAANQGGGGEMRSARARAAGRVEVRVLGGSREEGAGFI